MTEPAAPLLRADAVFHCRDGVEELCGVTVTFDAGKFTLLSGGCADALLRVLGLLERPDRGEVWIESQATSPLDDCARTELRNRAFGFVFAEPFLLDSFSVAENVAMPLFKISALDIEQARVRTAEVLDIVRLAGAADLTVFDLSTMDRHKVSLARALANAPRVLIAEDAGAQLSAGELGEFAALLRAAATLGVTVIATSPAGAETLGADREIVLEAGEIVADTRQEEPAHD